MRGTFWERYARWDWDLSDLADWFTNLAGFHISEHGWIAGLIIVVTVWVLLLITDATSHATSLVTASLVRAVSNAVAFLTIGVLAYALLGLQRLFMAKARTSIKILGRVYGKPKDS